MRNEDLLDIGKEGLAVDGAIQNEGRGDRVVSPQRGEKRQRLPMAVRDLATSGLPAGGASRAEARLSRTSAIKRDGIHRERKKRGVLETHQGKNKTSNWIDPGRAIAATAGQNTNAG